MTRARAARALGAALALAIAAAPLAAGAEDARPQDPTRKDSTTRSMSEVYDAMRLLLPLSFTESSFSDPTRQDEIRAALAKLAESSERLEAHAEEQDAAFAYLSHSLAIDARDIRSRFAEGHLLEVRFLVQTLAETCIACHSRLPAEKDALRSASFVDREELARLPLLSRAKLAYATRRFERALELYEELFASPEASPNDFDLDGALDDYLELCIHVRRDFERPRKTLARLARRPDLSERLRGEIAHWQQSLAELAARGSRDGSVAEARRLLARAQDPAQFADEREALVLFLAASGVLHRAVAGGTLQGTDLAEAYYLLGIIETQIGRSFWLSQAEAFLETAIRTAPGTRVAEDAYAALEDFLIAGFSGSAGTNIPPDIAAKLDELLLLAGRPGADEPNTPHPRGDEM